MRDTYYLIDMEAFVLQAEKERQFETWREEMEEELLKIQVDTLVRIRDYAKFLMTPLELWMFVPCDEDGNVLEEPDNYKDWSVNGRDEDPAFDNCREFLAARQRMYFKGFEVDERYINNEVMIQKQSHLSIFLKQGKCIRDIIPQVDPAVELTPSALKMIDNE